MTLLRHAYTSRIVWTGNGGSGTERYTGYRREYRIEIAGKPDLVGTSDPMFRGNPALHNPEDLFLAAIAACHMLMYLAICARRGVRVVAYDDTAQGVLQLNGGVGAFAAITLRPRVVVDDPAQKDLARQLHAEAHGQCFLSRSCSVPIVYEATVEVARERAAAASVLVPPPEEAAR